MMDCATTGIEPDLALVKYKKLVGGGMIKIVATALALFRRRSSSSWLRRGRGQPPSSASIDATGTIEGAPAIKPEHLAVFDCSSSLPRGPAASLIWASIKMMGATQPFLSGAISKTVNLPQDHRALVDDIAEAYMESWRQGLKAVAIYRDNPGRAHSRSQRHRADGRRQEGNSQHECDCPCGCRVYH